jgi:hypothetical protein
VRALQVENCCSNVKMGVNAKVQPYDLGET